MYTTLILIALPIIIVIGYVLSRPFMKHESTQEQTINKGTGKPESDDESV